MQGCSLQNVQFSSLHFDQGQAQAAVTSQGCSPPRTCHSLRASTCRGAALVYRHLRLTPAPNTITGARGFRMDS